MTDRRACLGTQREGEEDATAGPDAAQRRDLPDGGQCWSDRAEGYSLLTHSWSRGGPQVQGAARSRKSRRRTACLQVLISRLQVHV